MPEGILDPFHDASQTARLLIRNAGSLDREVDDLRDRKEAQGHRNQSDTVPEIEISEGVPFGP